MHEYMNIYIHHYHVGPKLENDARDRSSGATVGNRSLFNAADEHPHARVGLALFSRPDS